MIAPQLRESTLQKEGTLQVSRLQKIGILLDEKEIDLFFEHLLSVLKEIFIFSVKGVLNKNQAYINNKDFIDLYKSYVRQLQSGKSVGLSFFDKQFTSIMSCAHDILYAMPVGQNQEMIKSIKPIVQLQNHQIQYSSIDEEFRLQVLGKEVISWGIFFTYPQLFQDPYSKDIVSVNDAKLFPNTLLFREIQRWVRHHTRPVTFIVNEKKIKTSIRLGLGCFSWINNHPELKEQGFLVDQI